MCIADIWDLQVDTKELIVFFVEDMWERYMNINIIARKGVIIDKKEILLGNTVQSVLKDFPEYDAMDDIYYFFQANLALATDNGLISEIEVRNSGDGGIMAFYEGMNIFKEEKEAVLTFFRKKYGNLFIEESSTDFSVENRGIVFSFGMSEEGVEDIIQETKKDGIYEKMKEDIEKDIYRSKHIETFLIR